MPNKILYLGNKLSKSGKNITTIESLSKKLSDLSYNVKSYSCKKHKLQRLFDMLLAVIRHKDSDYLIIDTYSTSAFWFAYLSSRLALFYNIKYIPILHGGNLEKRLQKNPLLSDAYFSRAYINVAPSEFMLDVFSLRGFKNLKRIPNPINIEDYPYKERKFIKPNIIWVRAFAEIYNPMMAIKVLEHLVKLYPEAVLCMVGPVKDKSYQKCRNYAEQNKLPVTFTGQLSKKEWISYTDDFDIFINTTTVDNTPLSVIEAMALGLSVVSTNVGGLPYLIEDRHNGMLIQSNDIEAMSDAIIELMQKPELTHKISKNARKFASSYDWDIVKAEWDKILK